MSEFKLVVTGPYNKRDDYGLMLLDAFINADWPDDERRFDDASWTMAELAEEYRGILANDFNHLIGEIVNAAIIGRRGGEDRAESVLWRIIDAAGLLMSRLGESHYDTGMGFTLTAPEDDRCTTGARSETGAPGLPETPVVGGAKGSRTPDL